MDMDGLIMDKHKHTPRERARTLFAKTRRRQLDRALLGEVRASRRYAQLADRVKRAMGRVAA